MQSPYKHHERYTNKPETQIQPGEYSIGRFIEKKPERLRNQDNLFATEASIGVADGMGGYEDGDKVALLAVIEMQKVFLGLEKTPVSFEKTVDVILEALKMIQEKILEKKRKGEIDSSAGSTLSFCHVWKSPEGKRKAILVSAGDSPVYIIRGEKLIQVLEPDDIIKKKKRENPKRTDELDVIREILKNIQTQSEYDRLTPLAKECFDTREKIGEFLGKTSSAFEPSYTHLDLEDDDEVFLCTDGISDNLTEEEMRQILCDKTKHQSERMYLLGRKAKARSQQIHLRSKSDDMTGLLLGVTPQSSEERADSEIQPGSRFKVGDEVVITRSSGSKEIHTITKFDPLSRKFQVKMEKAPDGQTRVRNHTEEELAILQESIFKPGEQVDVLRYREGKPQRESGWRVDSFDAKTLRFRVVSPDRSTVKEVSAVELLVVNPR